LPDPSTRYDRAITFGTLSKSYGLPGLRVGWCIAPPGVIADCIRWRDYITLALSPLVEFVAIRAVSHAETLLRPRLAQARHNLHLVTGWMAEHEDLVDWARPDGGVTAFPRLRGVPDVEAFCHGLMRDHGVLTVPGTCFGLPGHIRLGFGGGTAELRQGLAAMSELLRARR
jgi:aspartate/methionine/tyrosine aminotransferase